MWKVSLLVTTYNVRENLKVTLASIEQQDYPLIEVIMVDGQSNDGTLEVIREFAGRHEGEETNGTNCTVQWISEPDGGLDDAMNKAFRMCTGDLVAVCNDRLCRPDAVTKLVRGEKAVSGHMRTWSMWKGNMSSGHGTWEREDCRKDGFRDIRPCF